MTDWLSNPKWQTRDEQAGTEKLAELDAKHARAVAGYEAERAKLEAERREASERTEQQERRLLKAQGVDPLDPAWVALARFVARYAAADGKLPSAAWYVVNQFIGTDPGTRPEPLTSNSEEVEMFALDGGLVVDTKDLFSLREKSCAGDVSKEDARTRLRASGRLFA